MKTGLKENLKESLHALAHRKEFWIAVVLYALAAAVIGMMFASCAAGSVWWDEYFRSGSPSRVICVSSI